MLLNEKDWMQDRDNFIQTHCGQKKLPSKMHIFLMEVETIKSVMNLNIAFKVLVGKG